MTLRRRYVLLTVLVLAAALCCGSCSHSQSVQVLEAAPQTPFRTRGMVSGHGPNDASALAMVLDQAQRLDADAVIIERSKVVGSQVVITARAITYLAPPPAVAPPAE